jgi:hypothetical protein
MVARTNPSLETTVVDAESTGSKGAQSFWSTALIDPGQLLGKSAQVQSWGTANPTGAVFTLANTRTVALMLTCSVSCFLATILVNDAHLCRSATVSPAQ